jgi:outer membrane protein insertion porin family
MKVNPMPQTRSHFILLLFSLLVTCLTVKAQEQSFKIAKIEFEGLSSASLEETIESTGLKVGQTFDVAAVDAAAQRLVDSGLFKSVAYRTRATRDQMTITFQVVEAKVVISRVIFDNFIWFTDAELIAAVKRDVPGFDGSAPDNGDIVDRIKRALRTFLHEQHIEADVSYMLSQDSLGNNSIQEHIFTVTDIQLPICSLHFPGATNVPEQKLIASAKPLVGGDYSNKFVTLFAANSLLPIYRELGQLKATFAPPQGKPEKSATCLNGVDVTIPVYEGEIYKWDKAEWRGTSALTEAELNTLLGIKTGEVANGVKVDKATQELQKAYGRTGHLLARIKSTPEFNDTAKTVIYQMDVREGPQFRMGKLIPKGFSDKVTKDLVEQWKLKPGDVFDDGYAYDFSRKQIGDILRGLFQERQAQGKPIPNIKWSRDINRATATVDVAVELTN